MLQAASSGGRRSRDLGIDVAFYRTRQRPVDEELPWDHVNVKKGREYLEKEQERSVIQLRVMAEAVTGEEEKRRRLRNMTLRFRLAVTGSFAARPSQTRARPSNPRKVSSSGRAKSRRRLAQRRETVSRLNRSNRCDNPPEKTTRCHARSGERMRRSEHSSRPSSETPQRRDGQPRDCPRECSRFGRGRRSGTGRTRDRLRDRSHETHPPRRWIVVPRIGLARPISVSKSTSI